MTHVGFSATVVADHISPRGHRLTTMVGTFPRIILAEQNTHTILVKNSASSRALPVVKLLEQVKASPFVPVKWGKNQAGMQAAEELDAGAKQRCEVYWLLARDEAVRRVEMLHKEGLHKQTANRLLEPWMWTTTVVTGTEWDNFYALRDSTAAQPEMQVYAALLLEAHNASRPKLLYPGQWALPFVTDEERAGPYRHALLKWSVARCARVSYLNHDRSEPDTAKDEKFHDDLALAGHMSPFGHQGSPQDTPSWSGQLYGWTQYRKTIPGENRDRYLKFKKYGVCRQCAGCAYVDNFHGDECAVCGSLPNA